MFPFTWWWYSCISISSFMTGNTLFLYFLVNLSLHYVENSIPSAVHCYDEENSLYILESREDWLAEGLILHGWSVT